MCRNICSSRTYYIYDGDTIIAELDSTGNPVVEYHWGLLGPIARLDLTNPSNNRYYILDALGHTRLLLDNAGNITDTYVYDAWGNLLKGSEFNTPNPFTWNGAYGYEWIEFTGLYHVGAREYDPRTARWLQRDPIGVGGGHPNVYLYCGNEPVGGIDVSGCDWLSGMCSNAYFASQILKKYASRPTTPVAFICVGDTSWEGYPIIRHISQFAINMGVRRDVHTLRREFENAGYKVVIDWSGTSDDVRNALRNPNVKAFAFIGHSVGNNLISTVGAEEDGGISDQDILMSLRGRNLDWAVMHSCYSALPDPNGRIPLKDALVGSNGKYEGSVGKWQPVFGYDQGSRSWWGSSKKRSGNRKRAGNGKKIL
jgi:RHS repeat-associated protein